MSDPPLDDKLQQLLDRWVRAIEDKDLDGLAAVFAQDLGLVVFWSNGERTLGWEEARRHIETDLRSEVELRLDTRDVRETVLGDDVRVLTFRYEITVAMDGDSVAFGRLASMAVQRDRDGWRVAALHVSKALPTAD